jgi:CRP-like cAMP-binding protein
MASMNDPRADSDRWDITRRATFLATVRLFQGIPEESLSAIAARFHARRVANGEFLFLEGDQALAVSLLAEGRIKVIRETEDGREVIVRLIQPGDIFGGAGGWGESRYPASAVALADGVVLQLSASEFQELLATSPEFAHAVIRELGARLREAEARIRDLQIERAEQRIARTLLRLAGKTGIKTPQGVEIGIALSRQDLADLSGTNLSTASRTVSAWNRRGLINAGRERFTIEQPHALVAIAEDLPA